VVLPAVLAVLFLGPPWLTVTLVAAALGAGLVEFFALLRAREIRPLRGVGFVVAVAVFLEVAWPGGSPLPLLPLGVLLLLTVALSRGEDLESVSAAAATLLGAAYVGALGGTIAGLRLLAPSEEGAWRLTLLLVIVMLSDTLAFFVGNARGRHRLAPAISPGKSVEGALGGLVGGVLGALVVRHLGLPDLPLAHAVALGAVVAAMGIAGDLSESLFKRWAGVKDSGTLFPGHGGMLDRLDSLLFGAPVLYYYFLYVR
jgi:phosphatidate cytidylyltransferase